MFQQHYCYNVTGQSQESEGSYKPARIKEVHSKQHSFQAFAVFTNSYSFNPVCTYIRLSVPWPLGCLIKQAGIINNYPYCPKFVGNTGSRTHDLWLDKCTMYISNQQLYHLRHVSSKFDKNQSTTDTLIAYATLFAMFQLIKIRKNYLSQSY